MKLIISLLIIIAFIASSCIGVNNIRNSYTSCADTYNSRNQFRTSFSYVGLKSFDPFNPVSQYPSDFYINGELVYDRTQKSMVVNYDGKSGEEVIVWIFGLNNTKYSYHQSLDLCIKTSYNRQFPNPFYVSGGFTTVGSVPAESLVTKTPNEFGATIVTVDLEYCSPLSIVDYNQYYTQVTFDEYQENAPAEYFNLIPQCNHPMESPITDHNQNQQHISFLNKVLNIEV